MQEIITIDLKRTHPAELIYSSVKKKVWPV
jgi:hypothetical protein